MMIRADGLYVGDRHSNGTQDVASVAVDPNQVVTVRWAQVDGSGWSIRQYGFGTLIDVEPRSDRQRAIGGAS